MTVLGNMNGEVRGFEIVEGCNASGNLLRTMFSVRKNVKDWISNGA